MSVSICQKLVEEQLQLESKYKIKGETSISYMLKSIISCLMFIELRLLSMGNISETVLYYNWIHELNFFFKLKHII